MQLKIVRVRENQDLPLPAYQSPGAAGLDLRADIHEAITLKPGERGLIPTGIALEIPLGFEGQVRARSGLALKQGLGMANAPGTIDADYRGEIGVIAINFGQQPVTINRGDRIAQLVICPVIQLKIIEVKELVATDRGSGGFGSTGKG
jgi:dUTP pyrophosphatase